MCLPRVLIVQVVFASLDDLTSHLETMWLVSKCKKFGVPKAVGGVFGNDHLVDRIAQYFNWGDDEDAFIAFLEGFELLPFDPSEDMSPGSLAKAMIFESVSRIYRHRWDHIRALSLASLACDVLVSLTSPWSVDDRVLWYCDHHEVVGGCSAHNHFKAIYKSLLRSVRRELHISPKVIPLEKIVLDACRVFSSDR